jgi:nucleoside-triphosphatase THEP1
MNPSNIVLITGEIESGKTSFCQKLADTAQTGGYSLSGLLSPGIFEDGKKTAIDLLDLESGERQRLAVLKSVGEKGISTTRWSFDPETIKWGNRILQSAAPSDLLIIDELGPLEFSRAQGLIEAFDLIKKGDYQVGIIVIRPALVHQAYRRWKINRILDLSGSGPFPRSVEDFLKSLEIKP